MNLSIPRTYGLQFMHVACKNANIKSRYLAEFQKHAKKSKRRNRPPLPAVFRSYSLTVALLITVELKDLGDIVSRFSQLIRVYAKMRHRRVKKNPLNIHIIAVRYIT